MRGDVRRDGARREAEEKEQQRRRSEEAFEEWRKKAQSRPPPARNSFGYTCGKLTGESAVVLSACTCLRFTDR